jgi:hypothetical protein
MLSGSNPPPNSPSGRSTGLIRGVLDFELDIGTVGDVDLDPFALQRLATRNEPLNSGSSAGDEFEPSAFLLPVSPWLSIQGNQFGQSLFIGEERLSLPNDWKNPDFPFVRGLPDGRILVSDTSFESSHRENTWILSRKGEIEAKFAIGSAAVEICPLDGGLIAVAYHPLSAKRFGHKVEPQQRTAIAFFDYQGRILTSFNHESGRLKTFAENVRCLTKISPTELLFIPERLVQDGHEVENPAVFYNCASGRTLAISTPYIKSEAVSLTRGPDSAPWILMASPEGFEDQVIAFDPARKISQYLGSFVGIFRGLSDFRAKLTGPPGCMAGGFLAQEIVAEYQWVMADPKALPAREIGLFDEERSVLEESSPHDLV